MLLNEYQGTFELAGRVRACSSVRLVCCFPFIVALYCPQRNSSLHFTTQLCNAFMYLYICIQLLLLLYRWNGIFQRRSAMRCIYIDIRDGSVVPFE